MFKTILWTVAGALVLVWATDKMEAMAADEGTDKIITEASENMPTVIWASTSTAEGQEDNVVVVQPENSDNPLGNPLIDVKNKAAEDANTAVIGKVPEQNPQTLSVDNKMQKSTKDLGKQFDNTLLEANNRIYDIQSYPQEDMEVIGNKSNPKTIYSPNVN